MRTLPPYLKTYFWDSDFTRLNLSEYGNFILGRLMLYGDSTAIKFVLNNFARKDVDAFLLKKGGNALDRKSYNFWNILVSSKELWKNENILNGNSKTS